MEATLCKLGMLPWWECEKRPDVGGVEGRVAGRNWGDGGPAPGGRKNAGCAGCVGAVWDMAVSGLAYICAMGGSLGERPGPGMPGDLGSGVGIT